MATYTVAAIQTRAHDRETFPDVWPQICDRVEDAARNGAAIIVLPEGTIPAYVLGDDPPDVRQIENALADIRDRARRLRVVVTCGIVRTHASLCYNSAIVVDANGDVAGYADKTFLWHFDRRWFAAGEHIAPIRTSVGLLGVLVCADGRLPTISRALVDAGAQMLVMPTAWVTSGRNPDVLENVQADLFARVRARENAVPFIAANKCGVERGCVAYCGKSQIVDADGTVLALGSQHDPQVVAADVTLGTHRPTRMHANPVLLPRERSRNAVRVAITPDRESASSARAKDIVEALYLIAPDAPTRLEAIDAVIPTLLLDDAAMADPGAPARAREAGYQIVVWDAREPDAAWMESLARTRALELRVYVIVLDRVRARAYAVDPDGTVVAGTFGDYRTASLLVDPIRTLATQLAPGTDIAEGLERVARITSFPATQ